MLLLSPTASSPRAIETVSGSTHQHTAVHIVQSAECTRDTRALELTQNKNNSTHTRNSLAGTFLRRFFTAAGGVCHSLVLGCGAVGLFSINYFRKQSMPLCRVLCFFSIKYKLLTQKNIPPFVGNTRYNTNAPIAALRTPLKDSHARITV